MPMAHLIAPVHQEVLGVLHDPCRVDELDLYRVIGLGIGQDHPEVDRRLIVVHRDVLFIGVARVKLSSSDFTHAQEAIR